MYGYLFRLQKITINGTTSPYKNIFKNLNYGASMFKMYTHPLCRCRQPWGNGSLPAVTVQQWYVFTCCIHTLHIYIYYMYKLLYCESPCTQANWEKKVLALFTSTSLETGYAGYHVHFSYVAWVYKATLQKLSLRILQELTLSARFSVTSSVYLLLLKIRHL